MLAAAYRLSGPYGRWLLAFGGGVSTGWGVLAAWGPSSASDLRTMELWLPMPCCSA